MVATAPLPVEYPILVRMEFIMPERGNDGAFKGRVDQNFIPHLAVSSGQDVIMAASFRVHFQLKLMTQPFACQVFQIQWVNFGHPFWASIRWWILTLVPFLQHPVELAVNETYLAL